MVLARVRLPDLVASSEADLGQQVSRVEFRVLGPLELVRDGEPVALGPGRPRALLAYLLVNANEVVPTERLIEDLWRGAPPSSASHAIQVHVSALRRVLEPDRQRGLPPQLLITRAPGYVLVAAADSYDVHRFVSLVGEGQTALDQDHPEDASNLLGRALDLWRGPALVDFADEPWAVAEAVRLQELRLAATERRVEADLALGRHAELVSELERLEGQHPFRERLWAHLMLALYRSGRQTEALRGYQRVRRVLRDELGLEPGPELRELEARVLQQDPELDAPVSGRSVRVGADVASPVTSAPRGAEPVGVQGAVEEVRLVTALVADLVGSTSLADGLAPGELSLVTEDAIDRMAACIEALDGEVVDRSSAGVAALFGTPVAHEDDTRRAILAALQLKREVEVYGDEVSRSWNVDLLRARVASTPAPSSPRRASPVSVTR